jgi:hypothetical protein
VADFALTDLLMVSECIPIITRLRRRDIMSLRIVIVNKK